MREEKGKSMLASPNDFVVLDIETTGFLPEWDYIIEIGAIKYKNHVEVDRFTSLVQPPTDDGEEYIDDYITELTGITNEMLETAPTIENILPKLYNFLGDSIIIGHNVNFDINFLYDNFTQYLDKPLSNDFVDTMRLSRNLHPEEKHHRLLDLCNRYDLDYSHAHRSIEDCKLTFSCYQKLIGEINDKFNNFDSFLESKGKKRKSHSCGTKAKDIRSECDSFDTTHPLYGKVCVFTGTLEKMVRKDAMQLVANLGGINADSVTKKTNFLILGNNDYCKAIKDGKSNKQKKAEKLKLNGCDIEILPETVFYEMLDEEY